MQRGHRQCREGDGKRADGEPLVGGEQGPQAGQEGGAGDRPDPDAAEQQAIGTRAEAEVRGGNGRQQRPDRAGEKNEGAGPQQDGAQRRTVGDVADAGAHRLANVLGRHVGRSPALAGIVPAPEHDDHRQKRAALTRKTRLGSVRATSRPPIAGPTARARFWLTAPSAIASVRSGASSG